MQKNLLSILIFFVAVFIPVVGHAADIFLEKSKLNIVGEIRPGDAERVAKSVIEQITKNGQKIESVWVNSRRWRCR